MLHNLRFFLSFQNAIYFIMLPCLVPVLFVRVAGCHSGPLLWPSVLSKMYPGAAAGILLWRRGSFVVLVCESTAITADRCDTQPPDQTMQEPRAYQDPQ